MAHEFTAGELYIDHPWSRALPPNAPAGAAYLVIHNKGTNADTLLSASTPMADKAELHTHVMFGEVMKMQRVDSVGVPAGGEARFAPGGNHVMLFGLKQPLVAGEFFPLTLVFEKAGAVEVQVKVEQDAPAPAAEHLEH
ncbi:copper chaperone PCu(A)C [Pseudomonas sp. N040]|uniref:copper chaperone PCu(A)C n=1 Tax=Pseudomonas sp. N040 TaxID=2785325 RepID=UPI0018A265C0|nr:copper chaperone PCu(A)C [Pseudomonas sp. N040]MBF7730744.1 copper chaperone PCu(A)C [Pseudomonas sp. N040]MBW7014387.1 copper chaperone PCu(A)C [Pseudomonas sp. N040]